MNRKFIEGLLLGSKYIWNPLPTELNEEELHGLDDQMGYLDHVVDAVSEIEKKAYIAGFAEGVEEILKEYAEFLGVEPKPDMVVNKITAERRYLGWRK